MPETGHLVPIERQTTPHETAGHAGSFHDTRYRLRRPPCFLAANARRVQQSEKRDFIAALDDLPGHLVGYRCAETGADQRIGAARTNGSNFGQVEPRHLLDRFKRLAATVEPHGLQGEERLARPQCARKIGVSGHVASHSGNSEDGRPQ